MSATKTTTKPKTKRSTPRRLTQLTDAEWCDRLAALDAFLRHVCPRAPTEAEVRATAARLRGEQCPVLDTFDTLDALAA